MSLPECKQAIEKPPPAVTATPTKMIESETKQEHMTTINDISDLIRILRDDPAWAEAVEVSCCPKNC